MYHLRYLIRVGPPLRNRFISLVSLVSILGFIIVYHVLSQNNSKPRIFSEDGEPQYGAPVSKWVDDDGENYFVPRKANTIKTVYYATNWYGKEWPGQWREKGSVAFQECPFVRECQVVTDILKANAVVFHGFPGSMPESYSLRKLKRKSEQFWVYYTREAPVVHTGLTQYNGLFNWTATEMLDSNIVANYGFYVPLLDKDKPQVLRQYDLLLAKKSRMALIINSHCGPLQSHRWEWVNALQEHINVDILGKCGNGQRFEPTRKLMVRKIKRYHFYLAFENARCKDYVTEKFWFNALHAGAVPVVLGGKSKEDYTKIAPPNSFIYAHDFSSAKKLALYLKKVARNDTLYQSYLAWKKSYKLFHHHNKETNFPCLLCQALHNSTQTQQKSTYHRLDRFFSPSSICNYSKTPRDVLAFTDLVANSKF